jgi:hypothetical protein
VVDPAKSSEIKELVYKRGEKGPKAEKGKRLDGRTVVTDPKWGAQRTCFFCGWLEPEVETKESNQQAGWSTTNVKGKNFPKVRVTSRVEKELGKQVVGDCKWKEDGGGLRTHFHKL